MRVEEKRIGYRHAWCVIKIIFTVWRSLPEGRCPGRFSTNCGGSTRANRVALFAGSAPSARESIGQMIVATAGLDGFHRYEVLHYNPTDVFARFHSKQCTARSPLCHRAGIFFSAPRSAGAGGVRGADTPASSTNRFGRARDACRLGRQWAVDAGCHGQFLKRRQAHDECNGPGAFCRALESRRSVCFD